MEAAGVERAEGRGFDDLDEAIEVASKHPVAKFGAIDVRPLWEE
mgnify:CR=1 FL=1